MGSNPTLAAMLAGASRLFCFCEQHKAGKDYFKAHVTVVAEGVKGDPIAEAVAFLHDTVEDTSVTIEDIRTGFPKEVADTVSTLTHSKGISYAEYLWYIQQNSIAMEVRDTNSLSLLV